MSIKKSRIFCLSVIILMTLPALVQAADITNCTLDKEVYVQGETGYITVTVYNEKDDKIRVTEVTATIEYFYTDDTVYLQTFFTNATLPIEIEQGQTRTFHVPFSLPTNIASGYREIHVRVRSDLWYSIPQRWYTSDSPQAYPVMYIETPYKQQFEDLQAINNTTTTMMYVFGATALIFVLMTVFLVMLNRRSGMMPQS
jgi:hypothetical protein